MYQESAIRQDAQALAPYLSQVYRHLHRHPELAHQEFETNAYIRRELDACGVDYLAPAENITIAVVDSGLPGATVGVRCDVDALPVEEETGLAYASETPGVMHACGHDAHAAIGLGAARLLKAHMGQWTGKVKIIFQPAEEGEHGANEVMATGLVDDVDVFFGIHVWSPYPTGELHASATPVSAAVDFFTIRVLGRGGHGATPDRCCDALVAAAHLVSELQTAVSRRASPMQPALLTIGSFHAGSKGNIIAGEAELKGTIRSFDPETRRILVDALFSISDCVARAHGCTAIVDNDAQSDPVINDPRAADLARRVGEALYGAVLPQRGLMLGDDFANYGRIAPYCYAQVGIANAEKDTCHAHHNGHFHVDEDALPPAVAWTTAFAVRAAQEWERR